MPTKPFQAPMSTAKVRAGQVSGTALVEQLLYRRLGRAAHHPRGERRSCFSFLETIPPTFLYIKIKSSLT